MSFTNENLINKRISIRWICHLFTTLIRNLLNLNLDEYPIIFTLITLINIEISQLNIASHP